ncbi:hypothetical protein K438DRAFT_1770256 [Mycena galopus ATCC 62051]|nr:hypothetical protein K438DRAFT_1770256 [Mycena galopus ATCC 62051]
MGGFGRATCNMGNIAVGDPECRASLEKKGPQNPKSSWPSQEAERIGQTGAAEGPKIQKRAGPVRCDTPKARIPLMRPSSGYPEDKDCSDNMLKATEAIITAQFPYSLFSHVCNFVEIFSYILEGGQNELVQTIELTNTQKGKLVTANHGTEGANRKFPDLDGF